MNPDTPFPAPRCPDCDADLTLESHRYCPAFSWDPDSVLTVSDLVDYYADYLRYAHIEKTQGAQMIPPSELCPACASSECPDTLVPATDDLFPSHISACLCPCGPVGPRCGRILDLPLGRHPIVCDAPAVARINTPAGPLLRCLACHPATVALWPFAQTTTVAL